MNKLGKKESISVVIPAYNEEETVEGVVNEALNILEKTELDFEIVLVNDGSSDRTGMIINRLGRINKRVRAVHHKQNKGFTGAMKTSFQSAKKNLIFLAPADGQFDFKEFPKFIKAIKGHDVATAYIVENQQPLWKKVATGFFHLPFLFLSRYLLGIKLREFSTVSLWKQEVVRSVEVKSDSRSAMFLPELVSKAFRKNYIFTEVPIKLYQRRGGRSKGASLRVAFRTFVGLVQLWLGRTY